jgi:hypothetical protein
VWLFSLTADRVIQSLNHSKREKSKRLEYDDDDDDDEREAKKFCSPTQNGSFVVAKKSIPGRKSRVTSRWDYGLYSPGAGWCSQLPYSTRTRL